VHVDDRAAAVAGQDRREGAGDQHRAPEVGVELAVDVGQVAAHERLVHADPRVVDEHGHVGGGLGGTADAVRVGHVQLQRDDARVGDDDRLGAAGGGVDLRRTALEEFGDEGGPEAAVGAGDEGDASGEIGHGDPPKVN
jgi:hypothetical protein